MGDRGAAGAARRLPDGPASRCCWLLERVSRGGRRFHPTTTRQPAAAPGACCAAGRQAARDRSPAPCRCCWASCMPGRRAGGADAARSATRSSRARFLPFACNSLMLAAITAALAVLLAALMAWARAAASRRRCAPRRTGSRRSAMRCRARSSRSARWCPSACSTMRWMPGCGRASASPPGCCCRAPSRRWSSPIWCASWRVALSSVESGLARLKPSLLRRRAGAGPHAGPGGAGEVELPLARGALLTAGVLVFVDTMKELPATLIVRPFDFDTLAVRVLQPGLRRAAGRGLAPPRC